MRASYERRGGRQPVLAPQLHAAAMIKHLDQPPRGSLKGAIQNAGPVRADIHHQAAAAKPTRIPHSSTAGPAAAKAHADVEHAAEARFAPAAHAGTHVCPDGLFAEGLELRRQVHALVAGHHEAVGVLSAQRLPRLDGVL